MFNEAKALLNIPQCEIIFSLLFFSMFVEPLKEAAFLDMNLLFRRMHDKSDNNDLTTCSYEHSSEKQYRSTANFGLQNIPYTKADPPKEENNSDIRISKDYPRIFLCATLWREERHEMLQLLKSLFR